MISSTSPASTYIALYPGCIAFEVLLAAEMLHPHRPVRVLTPGGEDHAATNGITLRASASYAQADPAGCGALLVPGGDPESVLRDRDLQGLLAAVSARGTPVGAICAGPLLLANAGLLKGKRFTHGYGDAHRDVLDRFWAGAEYCDRGVVVDGNLVTAQPQAYVDFAIEMLRQLHVVPDDVLRLRRDHYLGGA